MKKDSIEIGKKELRITSEAIALAAGRIDSSFERAVDIIFNCEGKTVVTGMGKTGIIGRKIAATLASTGTTSIYLHPAEGIHGDLGILEEKDVVLAVSYSGNTEELLKIIPYLKFMKIPVIAITGNPHSELAKNAAVVLDCSVPDNCEPFNLVPTVSTTVALALGDALAVALLKKKDFSMHDFARFHPGGTIGKKLLLTVEDLMHSGSGNPIVRENEKMRSALLIMTEKGLGCTSVVDENGQLTGIITDGDLRRILTKVGDVLDRSAYESMTKNPKTVTKEVLAVEALNLMETHKITMLPVINNKNEPIGMLHMHDLIDAGVVG